MPAHVTVVYPFLPEPALSAGVLDDLRAECAETAPFEVTFNRVGRFATVVYLAPEPAMAFRELTARFVGRWPEAPPYGGAHKDVIPHLTVADEGTPEELAAVETDLQAKLPLSTRVDAAELYVFDGGWWHVRERLAFEARSPTA